MNRSFIFTLLLILPFSSCFAQYHKKNELGIGLAYNFLNEDANPDFSNDFDNSNRESNAVILQFNYKKRFFSFVSVGVFLNAANVHTESYFGKAQNKINNQSIIDQFLGDPDIVEQDEYFVIDQNIEYAIAQFGGGISLQLNAFPHSRVQPFVGVNVGRGIAGLRDGKLKSRTSVYYQDIGSSPNNDELVYIHNESSNVVTTKSLKELYYFNRFYKLNSYTLGFDIKLSGRFRIKPHLLYNNGISYVMNSQYATLLINGEGAVRSRLGEKSLVKYMFNLELTYQF